MGPVERPPEWTLAEPRETVTLRMALHGLRFGPGGYTEYSGTSEITPRAWVSMDSRVSSPLRSTRVLPMYLIVSSEVPNSGLPGREFFVRFGSRVLPCGRGGFALGEADNL